MAQQIRQPTAQETVQQPVPAPQQSQFGQEPRLGQQPQQFAQPPQQPTQRATPPSLGQYEKTLPSEFRVALHDFTTVADVADWCRDQCLDKGPGMAAVVRICEDLTDVAAINEQMITHDSAYGPHVAEAFLRIARQSVPELQQYQQDPAVADTIPVVQRAVESTEKLLRSVGWQPEPQPQTAQRSQVRRQSGQQAGWQSQLQQFGGAQTPQY